MKKTRTLRGRLIDLGVIEYGQKQVGAKGVKPRAPRLCSVCRLDGHTYRLCQIRERLDALDLPRWVRGFNH